MLAIGIAAPEAYFLRGIRVLLRNEWNRLFSALEELEDLVIPSRHLDGTGLRTSAVFAASDGTG